MTKALIALAVLAVMVLPAGCKAPPEPPEVGQARAQESELVAAGAAEFAPARFDVYREQLDEARDAFFRERSRFSFLINYEEVAKQYRSVLAEGNEVMTEVRDAKAAQKNAIRTRIAEVEGDMADLDSLMSALNERRRPGRSLLKAELSIREAESLLERGDYAAASARVDEAEALRTAAVADLRTMLGRYADSEQLRKWRRLVASAVAESKASSGRAIVVKKIERSLVLYESGKAIKTYRVGLGMNGLADKLRAGDNATPEGRYHITKKIPSSAYYKALLINYPNEEDRKRFAKARASGQIPAGASIGGLVEIHGGGSNSVTSGCVSMDNLDVEELYHRVSVGTPVVIVGTTEIDSALESIIGGGQ